MRLEVYQTDAEAYEAAAALVAERLVGAARAGRATLALPGGRGGRVFALALAARGDVSWPRVDVFVTDEACLPDDDPRRTAQVLRASLLAPRGVPAERVHTVDGGARTPDEAASGYADALARELGVLAALDLVVLDLGDAGELAAVAPGSAAAASAASVVAVLPATDDERAVARVTLTPATWRAARHVVVTATGAARAAALAAALREPADPVRRPAQAVLPSASATWFVDRAAAELLLRDAQPVAAGQ